MKRTNVQKLTAAGVLVAVAVVGSLFSFPVLGSKCAPIQHMVNIVCAVFLGPWYGVGVAFAASLIRVAAGLGTLMAFPGSMVGALLCGLIYHKFHRLIPTCLAEMLGTSVLGGLAAYPVAILLLSQDAASVAFYAYIIPFLISTAAGSLFAGVVLVAMDKAGLLKRRTAAARR